MNRQELIKYYSRRDIQMAIVENAKEREVAIRYNDSFGKRPDTINLPGDVSALARQGATSFHISEERWNNPAELNPGMTKSQLDDLRKGWDLVLDIDTLFWDYAKLTASLIVDALRFHDVENISVKFSGNKGFHIAVPFEAFPDEVNGIKIKDLFPEGPRIIASYIQEMITDALTTRILEKEDFGSIAKKTGKGVKDLVKDGKFNPYAIIDIDTILISNRHLFRSPYSIHEKTGLVSLPIELKRIMDFNKEEAMAEKVSTNIRFLDRSVTKAGEARVLLIQAFDWHAKNKARKRDAQKQGQDFQKEYSIPQISLKEELFPECIRNILKGGLKDGKKRCLFILINFLRHAGWDYQQIERLVLEWDKKNQEQLREGYIITQLNWHKRQKKNIPPPNCGNSLYYKDTGLCSGDRECAKFKNPINYVKRRSDLEKNKPKDVKTNIAKKSRRQ